MPPHDPFPHDARRARRPDLRRLSRHEPDLGSTFLAIRIGNEAVPPVWSAILRLALATVLYTAIALLTRTPHPRGAAFRAAVVYGFLNYGVNFVLLYWGERAYRAEPPRFSMRRSRSRPRSPRRCCESTRSRRTRSWAR